MSLQPAQSIQAQQALQYPQQPSAASAVAINIFNPQVPSQQTLDKSLYTYPQGSVYDKGQPYVMQPPPGVMPGTVLQSAVAQKVQAKETPEVVSGEASQKVSFTADELVTELENAPLPEKEHVMAKIALKNLEADPGLGVKLVSDDKLMNALGEIISQDTGTLQGPTDQQVELDKKKQSGQALTPEEETIYQKPYDKGIAEENQCIAMYTIAPLWDMRQGMAKELKQNPVPIQELPAFSAVLDTALKTDKQRIKLAAIRAITHAARNEDTDYLRPALAPLAKESDSEIKEALQELRAKLETRQA